MTFRTDNQSWVDKFDDLQTRINDVLASIDVGMYRESTLTEMVSRLKTFSEGQFAFFFDGFASDTGGVSLAHSYQYPPEYVFRTLLNQVHTDLTILQQAINQRLNGNERPALETADRLAMEMLRPAINAGFIGNTDTTVLTYYRKAARARIIAYAPVVLIGIPYTAVSGHWVDMLSIAHEVGHYVYRYGNLTGSQVGRFRTWLDQYAGIRNLEPWCMNWLEEIFADVYGTLLGGPDFADSLQKLLEDNSLKKFLADNKTHPLQPLRPQIHINTLNDLGANNEANTLQAQWNTHLEERRGGKPTHFTVGDHTEVVDTTIIEDRLNLARSWVMDVLNPILYNNPNFLQGVQLPQFWDIWADLKAGNPLPNNVTDLTAATPSPDLWTEIVKQEHQTTKANGTTPSFSMPPIAWIAFRSAGGWGDLPDNGDTVVKTLE